MGAHSRAENFFRPPGGSKKLKVNRLVVIVKIMFMWYKNVVATNITNINIPVVTLCDADFSVFFLEK